MSGAPAQYDDNAALLIFGGIYGNWQALQAVLAVARAENIPPRNFIITGDLAAYCADGARVVAYCQSELAAAQFVRGNCERTLAADAEDCGCGFAEGSVCRRLSDAWYEYARVDIPPPLKQWMGALPFRVDIEFAGRRLAVVHAAAEADNTFIFPSTAAAEKTAQLQTLAVDGVIAGHSGIPFTHISNGCLWHNSGALGMPANDGTAHTWYAIWRANGGNIRIYHHPLTYDYRGAAKAMQQAGLPADYQKTLANGIWPSDSVLPPLEKQQQGEGLQFSEAHHWLC